MIILNCRPRSCIAKTQSTAAANKSWDMDTDKPFFHVMPRDGWLNDPNGPIYLNGRYHVFYQHVIGSSAWDWGLVWGHASSSDLIFWEHDPIAIEPTREGYDADGCWSGNTAIDTDGSVVMLYTGVRLRKKSKIPLPPPERDLDLEQIESQCSARCTDTAAGAQLNNWEKQEKPVIPLPPTGLGQLTGFRDPFVFSRKSGVSPWKMIIGSGIKGRGGTILVYHSHSLSEGWQYQGQLEKGKSKPCVDGTDYDLGSMWECPFFVHLGEENTELGWMLCVSPYPHYRSDRPTNPCLYWLGSFQEDSFQLGAASGPKLLDLGDVAYAPTIFRDGSGRCLMLAWLQELRKGGSWDYAGCLSIPRVLTLQDGCLRQDPAEEIASLRQEKLLSESEFTLQEGSSTPLNKTNRPALDITLTLERGSASVTGILLRAWLRKAQEGVPCAEALVLDWEKAELKVIAPNNLDQQKMTFRPADIVKSIGGPVVLPAGGQGLKLRILIDHSLVEVFTEMGQVLTTRVYKAGPPPQADDRLFLFSCGGASKATAVEVYGMASIWKKAADIPEPTKVYSGGNP